MTTTGFDEPDFSHIHYIFTLTQDLWYAENIVPPEEVPETFVSEKLAESAEWFMNLSDTKKLEIFHWLLGQVLGRKSKPGE